ncbi:MAG TPA: zf-HC2 domain-containing protein [Candidatus Limnocylindrales bacterium]|nr:zf-HC2 domain-containing protein [Candidatus Limnocylindrales bacterium]
MIPCKEAVERLWSHLDRSLDQRSEVELEQHLGLCRHCCGELEFARQVRARLAEPAATEKIPPDVRERLEASLRRLES